ncbi:MAG: rhodanese-like domain-containing protein [Synechococcales bacterium]|nr:rhodanese-like domain-containing protein [Synechococcales bacterium]
MPLPNFVAALSVRKVTASDLITGAYNPVLFVDVRSSEYHTTDQIGSSIWIPLEEITDGNGAERLQALAQAYSQAHQAEPTLILYCTICPGAIQAYRHLQATGLKLAVLSGGLTAWRQAIPIHQEANVLTHAIATTRKFLEQASYNTPSEWHFQSYPG